MHIFFAILFVIGPRLAFTIYWLSIPEYVNRVFNTWFWPLLGVIVLPWTSLVYALAYGYNAIEGSDWLWLGGAFAVDMATYAGGVYYRVKGENAINPMKWIEQSTPFRILLYLLMLVVGFFAALFVMVAPLIGDGQIFPGFWVEFLAGVILVYLFLGFLFCFVDPTMPWLPALLLCAPAILVAGYFSPDLVIYVLLAAGAATCGAYLGALLLKTGKEKGSVGL